MADKTINITGGAPSTDRYGGLTRHYYWFFIIFMVLIAMFGSFTNDMYSPSLPQIAKFFGCSASTSQLGLSAGMLGLGLGQVFFGPYSDKYGRKIVLYIGMGVSVVGCVVSVFSPTIWFFLVCRLVQGIGGSTAYFLARTMPADVTGGRALARMMAVIGAINGIAPASSPALGGILAEYLGWQSVFVFLAVFSVIVLCVSPKIKETLPKSRRATGSLLQTFIGYKYLFTNGRFMVHVTLKGTALALLFAYVSACPFIIHSHYGYSIMAVGLFMGMNAVFVIGGSILALKFKYLKNAGVFGAVALVPVMGFYCIALWLIDSFWLFEALSWAMLFLLGLIFTMSNSLAMNEGRSDAGRASAILGVVGYALGAAVAPLCGIGNILHSTALVLGAMTLLILLFGLLSARYAPELSD